MPGLASEFRIDRNAFEGGKLVFVREDIIFLKLVSQEILRAFLLN